MAPIHATVIARYVYPDRPTLLRLAGGRVVLERRFVMERALGRALAPGEIVKTLDAKRPENDITNLMLVSQAARRAAAAVSLICACCKKPFTRPTSLVNLSLHRGCTKFYCSRRCVGRAFGRGR
jgi:hypothetical protein